MNMDNSIPATDRYLMQFEQAKDALPGAALPWLRDLRESAIARFTSLGFPTLKHEEWKYTSVAPIEKRPFRLAEQSHDGVTAERIERLALTGATGLLLVFVNGYFAPELSRLQAQHGVTLSSLAEALEREPEILQEHLARSADGHAFAALNTAFMADGAYIRLAPGTVVDAPIQLLFVSTASTGDAFVAHPRNLIVAEDNSQAVIIESYAGSDESGYFTNAVTEVFTGRNAVIEHYKLQQEGRKAFHIGMLHARQDRDSAFTSYAFDLGGALVRNDIRTLLDAEGADCTLNGLYVIGGRQHVDNHTHIDHSKPHGTSREYYKGVLDGMARGVFNGKVIVHPDAQKTDAHQSNKNLLLSENAEVDTKPQLEIYADDVKCSHGATVGQLDSDAIFYLQTRGIGADEARSLLTYAFASDIVSRIRLASLRARVDEILATRLPGAQRIKELV